MRASARSLGRSWRPKRCHRVSPMSILLLILGLVARRRCVRCAARAAQPPAHARRAEVDLGRRARADRRLARPAPGRPAPRSSRSARAARWRCAREEFKGLVEPVQEKLGRMESEIGRLERERRQAHGELAQMVRDARRRRRHAAPGDRQPRLRAASDPRRAARGARSSCATSSRWPAWWRTATSSSSSTIRTDGGALRPDMLVRLPGGKLIVVDAKVPLDAYLSALEAEQEDERELHVARHAKQTREHIAKLAAKGYHGQLDGDARVRRHVRALRRHLPGGAQRRPGADRVRRAAADPDRHADDADRPAAGRHTTAGAKSASPSRRATSPSRRASCTAGSGASSSRSRKVGRQLDSAITAYNEAVGSFDARVVPQVRRIEEAGAASDREVQTPPAVETTARAVTARLALEQEEPLSDRPAAEQPQPIADLAVADSPQTLQALELAPRARISAGARPARRSA